MSTCMTCSVSYLNAAGHHQCPQCMHNWKCTAPAQKKDSVAYTATCWHCVRTLPMDAYSKSQYSKGEYRRCKDCVAGQVNRPCPPRTSTAAPSRAAVPLPACSKDPGPKRQRETSPPRPVPQAGRSSSSTSPPREPRPAHLQEAELQPKWRRTLASELPASHNHKALGHGPSRPAVQGPQRRPPERAVPSSGASGTSGARSARAEAATTSLATTELRSQLARLQAQLGEERAHAGERTQEAVRAAKQQAAAELTRARQATVDAGRARLQQAENQAKAWERQAEAVASTNEQLRRAVLEKGHEAAARQREAEGANAKLTLLRRDLDTREGNLHEGRRIASAAANVTRREAKLRELGAEVQARLGAAEEEAAAAMRQMEEAEARAARRAQLELGRSQLELEVATLRAEAARGRGEVAERRASVPPPPPPLAAGGAGQEGEEGVGSGWEGEGEEELGSGELHRARGPQLSFGDALLVWEQSHHTVCRAMLRG